MDDDLHPAHHPLSHTGPRYPFHDIFLTETLLGGKETVLCGQSLEAGVAAMLGVPLFSRCHTFFFRALRGRRASLVSSHVVIFQLSLRSVRDLKNITL